MINLALGLAIGTAAMVVGHLSPALRRGELALLDWRLGWQQVSPDRQLTLLPLTPAQANDRRALADLVPRLRQAGAVAIGLDVPLELPIDFDADRALVRSISQTPAVVAAAHLSSSEPPRYMRPLPDFRVADGLSLPVTDQDGRVRRSTLLAPVTNASGQLVLRPTYLLEVLRRVDPALAARRQDELLSSIWGFREPSADWETLSPAEVAQHDLRGKTVLVGPPEAVHWQAAALQALLTGDLIRAVGRAWNFTLCLLAGTLAGLAFWRGRPMAGLVGCLALAVVLTVGNTALLLMGHTWAYLLGPLLATVLTGMAGAAVSGTAEYRRRQRVATFFRPYVSPQTVQALLRDPEKLIDLKSERRIVTVIFSDIAGFTSIAERLPTEEVVQLLNEYLTAMTRIIFLNNGTLDKYIGDEVMAVFGNIGPNDPPDDAYRAVKTALEMSEELAHLQEKWLSEGIVPMQIRIGINSGEALVGHIGSPQQMDFTVIGDIVNTAKRLEGLNKAYNTNILISQATYNYVKDAVDTRFLGPAPIKGRHEPVPVYALLGWQAGVTP